MSFWASPDWKDVEITVEWRYRLSPRHSYDAAVYERDDTHEGQEKPGPKPVLGRAMTDAERQARRRAKQRGEVGIIEQKRRKDSKQ
jgi:hypothetical protein